VRALCWFYSRKVENLGTRALVIEHPTLLLVLSTDKMHMPVCFQAEHLPLDRLLPWRNPQVHPNWHWQDLQRTSSPVVCSPQSSFRWLSEIFDSAFFWKQLMLTLNSLDSSTKRVLCTADHSDSWARGCCLRPWWSLDGTTKKWQKWHWTNSYFSHTIHHGQVHLHLILS
jgi:hypothetical protein